MTLIKSTGVNYQDMHVVRLMSVAEFYVEYERLTVRYTMYK